MISFEVDGEYLNETFNNAEVQQVLKMSGRRTRPFMITGLKIANGLTFGEKKGGGPGKEGTPEKPALGLQHTPVLPGVPVSGPATPGALPGVPYKFMFAIRVHKIKPRIAAPGIAGHKIADYSWKTSRDDRVAEYTDYSDLVPVERELGVGAGNSREKLSKEERDIEELAEELARRREN
jgi:hypothetical protein